GLDKSTKLVLAAALATVILGHAQSPSAHATFEVVSVKPTTSSEGRSLLDAVPGRLIMTNLTLRRLILISYNLQDYQLVGDPPWTESKRYDLQAKTDGNSSVREMEGPMLQAL